MRQWLLVVPLSVFALGCSHTGTKSDTTTPPKAAAPATPATVTEKPKAEANKPANASHCECMHKGDKRILESRSKEKGCELAYTKAGTESVVASSGHGTNYCEKALEKLRDKLKGAGYECQ